MEELHAAVARRFVTPAAWAEFDGYASRHLVAHLGQGGDVLGAAAVVLDRDWYDRQLTIDPTGVRFRAEQVDRYEPRRGLPDQINAEAPGSEEPEQMPADEGAGEDDRPVGRRGGPR